ncbi:hypothetical protein KR222_009012 [Zaprionus bogoriensis]|nr:hypothetical protein KR222_009012 [Zaprionus bogoriensis]
MRKLQIQVLTRDGRKNIYETDRFRNVADLKKRIGRTMNVPMAFSRLTYKGRLLTNDSILEDEGVKRMSTLELYWQPLVLTPKQYREKELELDKQDQKQRHVSRIAENYEQTVKRGGHERTPSGLRRTREQVRAKRSLSADDMKLPTGHPGRQRLPIEERVQEELSSTSSDEQDFLAAYWCCPKSGIKISRDALECTVKMDQSCDDDIDSRADTKSKPEAYDDMQCPGIGNSIVAGSEYSCNMLKDDDLLDEILDQRCLSCKHQPFRTGLRLTAGRMSRSIISNIRKNKKNHKK